jgi:transposase
MQNRELYARILVITDPWQVERVDLKLEIGEVHIVLGHAADLLCPCPECGAMCALHDHQPDRQWRHLDTCQYRTILRAAPPRSNCPEHGAIHIIFMPSSPDVTKLKYSKQETCTIMLHISNIIRYTSW